MSKYLIQDIVPTDKKRRGAFRAGTEEATEENDATHDEHSIHHPLSKERGVHESRGENPRSMIIDQIQSDRHAHRGGDAKSSQKGAHRLLGKKGHLTKPWTYDDVPDEESGLPPSPPRFSGFSLGRDEWSDGRKPWLPWLIGVAIVAVLVVLLLNFFAGATVTILPKHDTPTMDKDFNAVKSPTGTELPYAIMIETASLSLEAPATGEKTVTVKASGRIMVYNEQNAPQRLIKNTRFQNPDGKIYRINESINVPKASVSGGKTAPGFLEVTVYADEAGPEYNSGPTDFTLPGLNGSPSYKKVYARSKGEIAGGARGIVKTVADQDLKQAHDDLRVQLETKLRSKARGDLATNQIAYDQGIVVALGEPTLSKSPASADNKAIVTEEGTIYLVTFKRADLTRAIAKALVPDYKGEPVAIKNLDALAFSMDPQKGDVLLSTEKLSFSLKGAPEFTWIIDDAAIKKALLGVPKDGFNAILAQFPSVERAKATIRPMWKRAFPDDVKQISIVLVNQMSE